MEDDASTEDDLARVAEVGVGDEMANPLADFCTGATHCVHIVEVEVLKTVETTLVTCIVGVPFEVIVLVTGHVVNVV